MRFKPTGERRLRHYVYLVITETDEDTRPAGSKPEYMDYFHKGQIIICDVTGDGQPAEVATWIKPGHLDCQSERFETPEAAIEYAYVIMDSGFDGRKLGKAHTLKQQKKQKRKKLRNLKRKFGA